MLFITCILIFISCNKYKEYNTKEIAAIRERALENSQNILGKETYFSIYQMANDSIINWRNNELGKWKYFGNLTDFRLDSVFCVNKTGDKIIFSILRRTMIDDADGDGISYFYSVKIRNIWYFFQGSYLVILRKYYQEDFHTPLSFEKLKQIATMDIYRGYLKKGKKGQWEINERFFADITSVAWCMNCITQEDWDAAYLRWVNNNWSKRDTTNYEK